MKLGRVKKDVSVKSEASSSNTTGVQQAEEELLVIELENAVDLDTVAESLQSDTTAQATTSGGSATASFRKPSFTTESQSKKRKYDDTYLSFGIAPFGSDDAPAGQCVT